MAEAPDPDAPPDDDPAVPAPSDAPIANAVAETMRLLAWSRRNGFEFQVLQVGDVIIQGLKDRRPRFTMNGGGRGPRDVFEDVDPDFYKEST